MNHKIQLTRHSKQKGVVLIVALVMLLLITILGISSVKIAGNKTQIAGNSMFSMFVYHGAESTLTRSVSIGSEKHLIAAILTSDAVYGVPSEVINLSAEKVNDTVNMVSTARITPIAGTIPCPISSNPTSSVFKCRAVEISAQTTLPGTGARARHTEARSKTIAF